MSPTRTAASEPQSHIDLPPPQLFDILPALHELLARIDHSSNPGEVVNATPTSESELGAAYTDLPPLDPKELQTAILPLKAQLRRGLREVEKLPDIERTVQEQEEEIAELEDVIRRQEDAMRNLSARAVGMMKEGRKAWTSG